jgi:sirohydrochlorin cobaltochelatase
VGRGSSDPDANSDVYKLARILWEGSGYQTIETCFIGITHPRLEEGFRRAYLYQPKRIIVLPYFLFTGVLVKKIFDITAHQQTLHPAVSMACLPEMGLHPSLFKILREREIETQLGQVQMNCELCKFRLAASNGSVGHDHALSHAHHNHNHAHNHTHSHSHQDHHPHSPQHHHSHEHSGHHHATTIDPYADPVQYHQRIWQVP